MQKASQETPGEITIPNTDVRILRAKLILEEALETIEALGVAVYLRPKPNADPALTGRYAGEFVFYSDGDVNLEGVVDGCADISVVTVGTLIAFGVDDEPVLEEVDRANLRKFGPGGYRREDGKWMKSPDWYPPDVLGAMRPVRSTP